MAINLNRNIPLQSNSEASPYGDYQSIVDSGLRAAAAIQAITAQRDAIPEPKVGAIGNTKFDSVNPVKDTKEVADSLMRMATAFKADPVRFKDFRDNVLAKNDKMMTALKENYDPNYLDLFFSDASLETPENTLRRSTEAKTIEMQSDLKARLASKDDMDLVAKQAALRTAVGKKAEVGATLEMTPDLEQLAVKDAIIKETAKKAAAESPAGIANAQTGIEDYKQKRDILQGVQQESFKQKQQKRQAAVFNGKYITMYKDYAPDEVPDEEGFGAKFDKNKGHAARDAEKPMEELINAYQVGRVSDYVTEEDEFARKIGEKRMLSSLILNKKFNDDGTITDLDEKSKQELIATLKATPVLGGTPSPYYFAYLRYKTNTTKKVEQGFFNRLLHGEK